MTIEVNRPDVVCEVMSAFERYERALVENDVATMNEMFWESPLATRFGIRDYQLGGAAIKAWREREAPQLPPGRALEHSLVTCFNSDMAVVTTMFRYPGKALLGRQSQTWIRIDGAWRIASAHVSQIEEAVPAQVS